jgi:chemotaxis protein histidine kinase CheA
MRATDRPQFSQRWWLAEKPADVEGDELANALAEVEDALANERRHHEAESIDACLHALQTVATAVDRTIKQCDKKKHKNEIAVLKKFDDLVRTEKKRLQEAKKALDEAGDEQEDGDAEDESKLFDKDYLYKMLKLMRSSGKELRFGFGLNTNAPEASKLLLKRKGKPELLFKALKKTGEFSNRLLTYGYASADPSDGKTLVFRLEQGAGEPPQIIKLGRRYLRADKQLRFRKLKVVLPGGQTLEDTEPDTE